MNTITPSLTASALRPVSRAWFRNQNRTEHWRINTNGGSILERTSVIEACRFTPVISDDPSVVVFFDSYTHEIVQMVHFHWDEKFGDSYEEAYEHLCKTSERYWEIIKFHPADARAELDDYVDSISEEDLRDELAAIERYRVFRNKKMTSMRAEADLMLKYEKEWQEFAIWNWFRENGVAPKFVGDRI